MMAEEYWSSWLGRKKKALKMPTCETCVHWGDELQQWTADVVGRDFFIKTCTALSGNKFDSVDIHSDNPDELEVETHGDFVCSEHPDFRAWKKGG